MPPWTMLAKQMKVTEGVMVGWIIFSILTAVLSAYVLAHFFPKL